MALRQFGPKREARGAVRRLVELECGVFSDMWGEVIPHRVTDVSEDGVFIETDLLLDVGSEVTLTFYPPDWEEPLCVAGTVRRVELEKGEEVSQIGMGIGFEALRGDERRQLTHSMRCLRAEASYLLDRRTLVGIPVRPIDAPDRSKPSADPRRTVVGWSVPPLQPVSSRRVPEALPPEQGEPKPEVSGFPGGLDLATSLFADDDFDRLP
jgi:hypothetical protein